MRIKLFSDMINKELSFILPRTLIFNAIVYVATLPFYGFGVEIPLGILTGTAAVLVNFVLLGRASERAIERAAFAKRYMLLWFIIRMFIMAVFITAAIKIPMINLFAAVVPLFYPKLAYTLNAVYELKKQGRRRE